jgi:hypothetical protein
LNVSSRNCRFRLTLSRGAQLAIQWTAEGHHQEFSSSQPVTRVR